LLSWLQQMAKLESVEFVKKQWKCKLAADIPIQHNDYDCGAFVMALTRYIFLGLKYDYNQKHMRYVRDSICFTITTKMTRGMHDEKNESLLTFFFFFITQ
jgi:Ulp1 family protease